MPAKAAPRPAPALSLGAPFPEWEGIGLSGEARGILLEAHSYFARNGHTWMQAMEAAYKEESPEGGWLDGPFYPSDRDPSRVMLRAYGAGQVLPIHGQLTLMAGLGPEACGRLAKGMVSEACGRLRASQTAAG